MNENENFPAADTENDIDSSEKTAISESESLADTQVPAATESEAPLEKKKRAPRKTQAKKPVTEEELFDSTEEKPKKQTKRATKKEVAKKSDTDTSDVQASDSDAISESITENVDDTAKKDADIISESAECEPADEVTVSLDTENSDVLAIESDVDGQLSIPVFSISSSGFDIYSQEESDFEAAGVEENAAENDEDAILPPDELFAYRTVMPTKSEEEYMAEETEQSSDEQIYEETPDEDDEENVDGDGQYTLSDSDLQAEEYDRSHSDEEISKYDPKKPRRIDGRFDLVELFVFTLLAVMIITTFFFRHSIISGSSMEKTLHEGEHVIISDLFYTPKRGDVIVCEDYSTDLQKPIVKRVIAVAGDHIRITENGDVYVNGELQDEEYVFIDGPSRKYIVDDDVEEGEIFVMGDHRNDSYDSRDPRVGMISVDSVLGKVLFRFYPFDKFGAID